MTIPKATQFPYLLYAVIPLPLSSYMRDVNDENNNGNISWNKYHLEINRMKRDYSAKAWGKNSFL